MASTVVTALTVSGIRIARLQTQPLGFRNSLKDRGWVYLSHIYRIWLRFSVFIGLIVYNSVLIREVILFCIIFMSYSVKIWNAGLCWGKITRNLTTNNLLTSHISSKTTVVWY